MAFSQVSVPALLTITSLPVIESIVTGVLGVGVGVCVGVTVGVSVGVGVDVGVGVGLGVGVGVGDGVGVGVVVSSGSSATVPMGGVIVSVGAAPHPQPAIIAAIMRLIAIKNKMRLRISPLS